MSVLLCETRRERAYLVELLLDAALVQTQSAVLHPRAVGHHLQHLAVVLHRHLREVSLWEELAAGAVPHQRQHPGHVPGGQPPQPEPSGLSHPIMFSAHPD